MKKLFNSMVRPLIHKLGFDIVRYDRKLKTAVYPCDFREQNIKICNAVRQYTMTNPERINALIEAVRYVVSNKIDGAMVECGVWKGGSTMAMALTLNQLGHQDREIFLYDTFSGMSEPIDVDRSINGLGAVEQFSKAKILKDDSLICAVPLDDVRKNIFSTGYPQEKFHFIEGKVEDTIPGIVPNKIALLRLDTDWYESTKHELKYLFPLLKPKGVLIIDDYGHWEGARKAVDEYISEEGICILLNRIDYTARIAIKS